MGLTSHCDVNVPASTKFGEITQNNCHYR